MTPLEENDLILDLKNGQAAGLERLYGLYAKKIYNHHPGNLFKGVPEYR
jgi:hypothetical protein